LSASSEIPALVINADWRDFERESFNESPMLDLVTAFGAEDGDVTDGVGVTSSEFDSKVILMGHEIVKLLWPTGALV
jgi:hypothetical protein